MFETFDNLEALERIPVGIEGFEQITLGGLPKDRATLITGTPGTGKTFFCVECLYRGITQFQRPAVFITFEERPRDIARNVQAMNWHLSDLVKQKQLIVIDASPVMSNTKEVGVYNLSGLITQIQYAVKHIQAQIVFLDSISALFNQYSQQTILRQELLRLITLLKKIPVTVILTAERMLEYDGISRYHLEEFVADNVIILRNTLEDEKLRRTVHIVKMRGQDHYKGEIPFLIDNLGLHIIPIPLHVSALNASPSDTRISLGNPELDRITSGGVFCDSLILVSGPTGCGKTLLAETFAATCQYNEKVLYLGYEESQQQLQRNASAWGLDLKQCEQEGLLKLIPLYPESMELLEHLSFIRQQVEQFQPQRLILDSISSLERTSNERLFREFIIGLISFIKQVRICCLLTSTNPQLTGGGTITDTYISTITDTIILLRYFEIEGVMRRGLAVVKMRGSQHEKEIFEFKIDYQGLHLVAPFTETQLNNNSNWLNGHV